MISVQAMIMRPVIRFTLKRKKLDTVEKIRAMVADLEGKPHPEVTVQQIDVNGLYAEWLMPANARPETAILYLHGGGYVSGSPATHRGMVSQMAHETQISILLLDYSLAPEHPFPAALHDAVGTYLWLIDSGYAPENIFIAGDSAGGGLTLAMLLKLRDDNHPMPAGAICISPFADMVGTGKTMQENARKDPWLKASDLDLVTNLYNQDVPMDHPYVSPVYGNFEGLPPLLIQVGECEILLSDSERVAAKAAEYGVEVELRVWQGMWHVWHAFYEMVPESKRAIREMADFTNTHIGTGVNKSPMEMEFEIQFA